eukprot:COSAG06_NODE_56214_length_286_cov_0.315508_1_plen_31_part_01
MIGRLLLAPGYALEPWHAGWLAALVVSHGKP